MHALNTGVLAKEEGTIAYLAVMTIVTLVGIFITSFLIGTISNAIKDKIASLQEGRSTVIERNHVVIIGFDENATAAARYGEIAIGYKRFDADSGFQVTVNPKSKSAVTFGPDDDLIVIAPE